MKYCLPTNYEERKGEGQTKSWWKGRNFFMKAFDLINYMSSKGYMEDIPAIPTKVWYEKSSDKLKVNFHRRIERPEKPKFLGNPVPKFEDISPYNKLPYTDNRPKEIKDTDFSNLLPDHDEDTPRS